MIRFKYGSLSWEFSNPILGNEQRYDRNIALGRSAGGQLYRYFKGITLQIIKLKWELVPGAEKEKFQEMFGAITTNDFQFQDHKSEAWNARFVIGNVNFVETQDEKDTLTSYSIGDTSYRSTQRKNSRWSYEIEMEIWK